MQVKMFSGVCYVFLLFCCFLFWVYCIKSAIKRENAAEVFQKNSLIISSSRVTLFMMTLLG